MFFRIILIIFLVYIIVGFFNRLFAGSKNTKSQFVNPNSSEEKEGNITIKDTTTKKQKINKSEGDYVDFEDV